MKTTSTLSTFTLAAILALSASGCRTRLTDFTVLSSKNLDFAQVEKFHRGQNRVSGTDTSYIIIFIPTGVPHIKNAVDRALESVPGAVALVDGVVYAENWYFIIGANSFIVEGTPLIDPSLVKSAQAPAAGGHLVSYFSSVTHRQETKPVDEATFDALKSNAQHRNHKRVQEMLAGLD